MTQSLDIANELCRARKVRNVLLVEDCAADAFLAQHSLEAGGCSVTLCKDGESALAAVSDGNFDLGILDIQLPGIDGLETAKRIRDINSDLPIVISSGSFGNPNLIEVMRHGYIVVPKPFDLDKLRALAIGAGITRNRFITKST